LDEVAFGVIYAFDFVADGGTDAVLASFFLVEGGEVPRRWGEPLMVDMVVSVFTTHMTNLLSDILWWTSGAQRP
jgi:hypothetical protein